MKRILLILLVTFIAFGIISCTESSKNEPEIEAHCKKEETSINEEDKNNQDDKDKEEKSNNPIGKIDLPISETFENSVYKVNQDKFEYIDDNKNIKVEIKYPVVEVKNNSQISEKINSTIKKYALKNVQDEQYKNTFHLLDYVNCYIMYSTDDILSIYCTECVGVGKATTNDYGLNFDIKSGELIDLNKIDIDNDKIKDIIQNSDNRKSNKYATVTLSEENYSSISEEYVNRENHNDDYYIRDGKIAFMISHLSDKVVLEFDYNWKLK